jgi:hypothetical protein
MKPLSLSKLSPGSRIEYNELHDDLNQRVRMASLWVLAVIFGAAQGFIIVKALSAIWN